MKVYKDNL